MKLLELTLDAPAANLALDEALLEECEQTGQREGILRLWEPRQMMAVLGRASRAAHEVDLDRCGAEQCFVGRRASGGAAIVTGPGCLMYAVVLSYDEYPAARMVDQAHLIVLNTMAGGLRRLDPRTERRGTSDLALGEQKFSGNSLRCRRTHFLYHGTILYNFSLPSAARLLGLPPREPEYRRGRTHEEFLTNFPASVDAIRDVIVEAWSADEPMASWPQARCETLTREKYATDRWRLAR